MNDHLLTLDEHWFQVCQTIKLAEKFPGYRDLADYETDAYFDRIEKHLALLCPDTIRGK